MSATVRSHARTDVGRVREHNEDNFLVDRKLGLFVVCDGMGGHAAGEVASAIAVQALRDALKKDGDFIDDFAKGDNSVRPEDLKNLLESAAHAANAAVYTESQRDTAKRGMGTTLTALVLVGNHGFIAHVGDSRCYLVRGNQVKMLTEDHSVINELRRRGKLKPEIVAKIQNKNAVTRAVGVFETVEVDTFHFLTAPGDRYILCSDGLHGYVETEEELNSLVEGLGEETATQRLIDIANERGGKDNITAVIATLPADDGDANDLVLGYETLASMPFFRHLEPRELLRVQAMARPRGFQHDEIVVTEGQAGDSIFVVLKGNARVSKGDADIAKFEAGHFFGEMSLVEKVPRSATVKSDGPSQMLEIARADFFKILREEKDIGVKLLWNFVTELSKRLRATSQNLAAVKEQMNQVEDMTEALLFEDDPYHRGRSNLPAQLHHHAPQPAAPSLRAPKVPSLRAVTEASISDTIVPHEPVYVPNPSVAPHESSHTHDEHELAMQNAAPTVIPPPDEDLGGGVAVVQRRRKVNVIDADNTQLAPVPPNAPVAPEAPDTDLPTPPDGLDRS
jgi:serine/threonine protein phosphatase PrpC/CRP-like cAMP-binding protein